MKFIYGDIAIYRQYFTEVRLCNCYMQTCKGRFLVKKESDWLICPDEAIRLKLIKCYAEYYKTK